ncbi:hypothetical protein D3C80_1346270 [compost metagenome]
MPIPQTAAPLFWPTAILTNRVDGLGSFHELEDAFHRYTRLSVPSPQTTLTTFSQAIGFFGVLLSSTATLLLITSFLQEKRVIAAIDANAIVFKWFIVFNLNF